MKIPKEIQIFGRKIKIEIDDNNLANRRYEGLADYDNDKILLTSLRNGSVDNPFKVTEQCQDINFLHELFHWVFYLLSYNDLRDDEDLVQRLAEVFHQILPQINGDRKKYISDDPDVNKFFVDPDNIDEKNCFFDGSDMDKFLCDLCRKGGYIDDKKKTK